MAGSSHLLCPCLSNFLSVNCTLYSLFPRFLLIIYFTLQPWCTLHQNHLKRWHLLRPLLKSQTHFQPAFYTDRIYCASWERGVNHWPWQTICNQWGCYPVSTASSPSTTISKASQAPCNFLKKVQLVSNAAVKMVCLERMPSKSANETLKCWDCTFTEIVTPT